MQVVLLSGYHARSHQAWCERLRDMLSQWQWHEYSLPARHFSWRVRGSSLAFAKEVPWEALTPDLVIATSMTDVASLRGMVPKLRRVPIALYVHENQFAYPNQNTPKGLIDWQLTSIYSALASDIVIFNSQYNRNTFLDGARSLLAKLPDYASLEWVDQVAKKSSVIPVPLADKTMASSPVVEALKEVETDIVWNHRWEYDKGPDRLLEIVKVLQERGESFRMHVVGEQFRQCPDAFKLIHQQLEPEQRGLWGFLIDSDYFALLERSTHVLSTAIHDFQGLSVLTGAQYGCIPVVPKRLAYPEWIDDCYESHETDIHAEANSAVEHLMSGKKTPVSSLARLSKDYLAPIYKRSFDHLVADFLGENKNY